MKYIMASKKKVIQYNTLNELGFSKVLGINTKM